MIKSLNSFQGTVYLSDDVYVLVNNEVHGCYRIGQKFRLISGVNNKDKPGYHFNDKWVTACPLTAIKRKQASWLGFPKKHLKKVNKEK